MPKKDDLKKAKNKKLDNTPQNVDLSVGGDVSGVVVVGSGNVINVSTITKNAKQKKAKAKTGQKTKKYDEEISKTDTIFSEGKILQVVVSQLFRLADLLTYPDGVKAKKFYEAITNSAKYRRAMNNKSGFSIEPYGKLKPVMKIGDKYEEFWKPSIPNLRRDIDPLRFIPFELDLTENLKSLKPDPDSVLENVIKGKLEVVNNIQISGCLRIYPPGTGIIRMSITLDFKEGVHLEISAELARNIEKLLFVDPNIPGHDGIECSSIFLEIIDKVADTLFKDEMVVGAERRWQPPETMFNFRDFHGHNIDIKIESLARLMSYAPANLEKTKVLERRISKALRYPHWQKNGVFSAVGQGVALVIIPISDAAGKRENQRKLMSAFVNTRELISAAGYAIESFVERINEISREQNLNEKLETKKRETLEELYAILYNMKRVLYATLTIHEHLHKLGRGELMNFSKDLWEYDNPINFSSVYSDLGYITENLKKYSLEQSVIQIQKIINQILETPFLFTSKETILGRQKK